MVGPRTAEPLRIRWEGALFRHHSLSVVNRELVTRLAARPDLVVELGPQREGFDVRPQGVLAQLARRARPTPGPGTAVTVRHQWPPDLRPARRGGLVMFQPWEFGCVPQEWVDAARHVDEFWAYSAWVRDAYLASGVPPEQVALVPLGVDTVRFRPDGPRLDLPTAATTRLLFVGGTIARKGIDVLLRATLRAFGPDDDVCLVVKGFGSAGVYRGSSLAATIDALRREPGAPEIVLVEDELDHDAVAALYRACDVLVHPYRGEGFGLPVAEAMACGLPVVVSEGGPTDEFVPAGAGFRVSAPSIPLPPPADLPPAAGPMWWKEPDVGELAEVLRHVADHAAERAEAGRVAAAAGASMGWDGPADVAVGRLVELAARASAPKVWAMGAPPATRVRHPEAPGTLPAPRRPVGVVVDLAAGAADALAVLAQLEGDTLDGDDFEVVLLAGGADDDARRLVTALDGAVHVLDEDGDRDEALDRLAERAGWDLLVTVPAGASVRPGWWRGLRRGLEEAPHVHPWGVPGLRARRPGGGREPAVGVCVAAVSQAGAAAQLRPSAARSASTTATC